MPKKIALRAPEEARMKILRVGWLIMRICRQMTTIPISLFDVKEKPSLRGLLFIWLIRQFFNFLSFDNPSAAHVLGGLVLAQAAVKIYLLP
jgi:hypothetical protein